MASQDDKRWEDAFISFGLDASVGRLFRGIIHNLNGVAQAFSMQAELLNMMFEQAAVILEEISRASSLEEAREKSAKLQKMMGRRADLAKLLTGEVKILQEIMQRTSLLTEEGPAQQGAASVDLAAVIMTELEFLNSDGFFKHKIRKELALDDDLPALAGHRVELHQIVFSLLENASQALAANPGNHPAPKVAIVTATDGGNVEVRISDNGPGVAAADLENIFEPFFTTRQGHLGLGLHLARVMAGRFGGSLTCERVDGGACFLLKIPVEGARLEN